MTAAMEKILLVSLVTVALLVALVYFVALGPAGPLRQVRKPGVLRQLPYLAAGIRGLVSFGGAPGHQVHRLPPAQ